jgi:carboxymethylenebutenolidase
VNHDLIQDAQALLGKAQTTGTRRQALQLALGVGYAAAAGTVMAQTAIKTPSDGLVSGEVTIDVNGFKMPAFRSAPAGKSHLPVVLVISEIFGVHEYLSLIHI